MDMTVLLTPLSPNPSCARRFGRFGEEENRLPLSEVAAPTVLSFFCPLISLHESKMNKNSVLLISAGVQAYAVGRRPNDSCKGTICGVPSPLKICIATCKLHSVKCLCFYGEMFGHCEDTVADPKWLLATTTFHFNI